MLIETNKEKEIAKEFFIEFTNTTEVSKKLYPKSFENNSEKKNVGMVSNCFTKWKNAGYVEEKNNL